MNKNEARLLLNISEDENLDDVWEGKLFEQKQFFLTRPPIAKVFRSRLSKLEKMYSAYSFLTGNELDSNFDDSKKIDLPKFSNIVKEAFNQQQTERMKLKSLILNAKSPVKLKQVIESWLKLEKLYMEKWLVSENIEVDSEVVISKEPDPMYILEDIKTIEKAANEMITFEYLKNNLSSLPKRLVSEIKRLNLLYQKSYGG